jgi:hypothetical protein
MSAFNLACRTGGGGCLPSLFFFWNCHYSESALSFMPGTDFARTTRIAILLSDPLQGLARVVDRLAVQSVNPQRIIFRARHQHSLVLVELDSGEFDVDPLVARLRQIPSVIAARVYADHARNVFQALEAANAHTS